MICSLCFIVIAVIYENILPLTDRHGCRPLIVLAVEFFFGIVYSNMPGEIECPFTVCPMSRSVQRVLVHIHEVHESSKLPQDFIDSFVFGSVSTVLDGSQTLLASFQVPVSSCEVGFV